MPKTSLEDKDIYYYYGHLVEIVITVGIKSVH